MLRPRSLAQGRNKKNVTIIYLQGLSSLTILRFCRCLKLDDGPYFTFVE
jgi:hypothetical protein